VIRGLALAAVAAALLVPAQVPAVAAEPTSSLRWHDCDDSAPKGIQCGTLTVPVQWGDPSNVGRFRLPVGRIPASGEPSERIGALMYNPGGPGVPGVQYLRRIHALLPKEVQRRFDLVTWSPRGTEGTLPALTECPFPEIDVPDTGPIDWAAVATSYSAVKSAALADCFAANPKVAPFLGTVESARDIDALRRALGEKQVSFWGMSYGSTMGRIYAQAFPNRVRALVLDGAIDPMATSGSYAREQMWSHAMSMARMLQWQAPGIRAAHRRVMAALDERTVTTSWGAVITRLEVDLGLNELSGRQFNWSAARSAILAARDGLFAPTQAKRTAAADKLADLIDLPRPGVEEDRTGDFVLSFVNCADFPERISVDEIATVAEQAARIGGIGAGALGLTEATMCGGLPVYGTPIEQRPAIRIPNPPVVVNSVADPFTSLWSATLMANAFIGSRLITYDSTQHVTYSRTDSRCVNGAVTDYLLEQRLPARDLACPLRPPFAVG
jgi:pimeloyl-ACP methyl ester carboxylesterase